MTQEQAELEYLRYLFNNLNCIKEADEEIYFINAQYRSLGNYIPKKYNNLVSE